MNDRRGTATPIHNSFVLALAASLSVPVGEMQIVVDDSAAEVAVLSQSVEETLQREKFSSAQTKSLNLKNIA